MTSSLNFTIDCLKRLDTFRVTLARSPAIAWVIARRSGVVVTTSSGPAPAQKARHKAVDTMCGFRERILELVRAVGTQSDCPLQEKLPGIFVAVFCHVIAIRDL